MPEAILTTPIPFPVPPDQDERRRALDPDRSVIVQAPAGSGKTDLLTRRFLRLLALAEKPEEIVAITFTKAAAAEMRNRILGELEKAETATQTGCDPMSLAGLARDALAHSKTLNWQLLDQPLQLRITTIDSFCRGLALQSPLGWGLLSSLGGKLEPVNNPKDLYRQAARRTIELLQGSASPVSNAVEALLTWRDNSWRDLEDLLVKMLGARNRWWQGFIFQQDQDWDELRGRLEASFLRDIHRKLERLDLLLNRLDGSREFALELARQACLEPGEKSPVGLAELVELPTAPFADGLEDAQEAYQELAMFLLTNTGSWRKTGGLNVANGFPPTVVGRKNKQRFGEFVDALAQEPGLQGALATFQEPLATAYTDDEWALVRHCFAVLKEAAGQLQVVFSETAAVDFVEVAQIAQRVLVAPDGSPSDFALQLGDGIRHLLVDEFQDTSRNQHQLLSHLIAAWPEREGRSCFCVGDPMQSIYDFREAEVELFERVKKYGLEIPSEESLLFDQVRLTANFRTAPSLVCDLNERFTNVFAEDDGSGIQFAPAEAMRPGGSTSKTELHLSFTLSKKPNADGGVVPGAPEETRRTQLEEMVDLIREHLAKAGSVRAGLGGGGKYRIAVLGRARKSLIAVAEALDAAQIGYRAIELVKLRERPEVLDALALTRAMLNPADRTAWLGVLRAPWCGLSLAELHLLTSDDNPVTRATSVPELLRARLPELAANGLLSAQALSAVSRVARVLSGATSLRAEASGLALGTWIQKVWQALGGEGTVNEQQRENLRLLWACLDRLPGGELDLGLGAPDSGINAALEELYAQPDPAVSGDFGVQLMTIHKSKGLEFEVVIVPDLEARGLGSEQTLVSWLERGLAEDDGEDGQVTEFLIAPIQPKGDEAGQAKTWVDEVKKKRAAQEMRRLLYVAATRAREELHLFARPRFGVSRSGEFVLSKPSGSLLATAWPALEGEVEAAFGLWVSSLPAASGPQNLESLAAQAGNLIRMPGGVKATLLRRLPEGYCAPGLSLMGEGESASASGSEAALYQRTLGGVHSRLEGTAIHGLMERVSQLRESLGPVEAATELASSLPAITALVRGYGIQADAARGIAAKAVALAQRASLDPVGAWILGPHAGAASEAAWTGIVRSADGRSGQRSLRPDRVFMAPRAEGGEAVWWIIDYKTSHDGGADLSDEVARDRFLAEHREKFRGQLEAYAQVLKELYAPQTEVRAGIYYPRLLLFDSWTV